jgi:hypothetical protein
MARCHDGRGDDQDDGGRREPCNRQGTFELEMGLGMGSVLRDLAVGLGKMGSFYQISQGWLRFPAPRQAK